MEIWSAANGLGPSLLLGLMFACYLLCFPVAWQHGETFLDAGESLEVGQNQSPGPTMGQVSLGIEWLIVVELLVTLDLY